MAADSLWRRVRDLERDIFGRDADVKLIFVSGGPAALEPLHASLGPTLRLDARPDEPISSFADRALDEGIARDVAFVVVSGAGV